METVCFKDLTTTMAMAMVDTVVTNTDHTTIHISLDTIKDLTGIVTAMDLTLEVDFDMGLVKIIMAITHQSMDTMVMAITMDFMEIGFRTIMAHMVDLVTITAMAITKDHT